MATIFDSVLCPAPIHAALPNDIGLTHYGCARDSQLAEWVRDNSIEAERVEFDDGVTSLWIFSSFEDGSPAVVLLDGSEDDIYVFSGSTKEDALAPGVDWSEVHESAAEIAARSREDEGRRLMEKAAASK